MEFRGEVVSVALGGIDAPAHTQEICTDARDQNCAV